MSLRGQLFRKALFPLWETGVRRRPTMKYLRMMQDSQWWSLDQLLDFQSKELERLVRHSFAHVPFYRRRFEEAGLGPDDIRTVEDLHKLPILTRDQARSATDLESTAIYFPELRKLTVGTTGQPLAFGDTADSESWR